MRIPCATPVRVAIALIALATLTAAVAQTTIPRSSTHQITIAYEKPKNPSHDRLHDLLVKARVLEQVQEILSPFRLSKPLPISIESCDGEPDARYLYSEARIKVCYEYVEDIWKDLPPDTTSAGVAPIDAIVGPLADVFFHEFGHALFDLHKIPVLGREEHAADTMSALLMLAIAKDESRRLILGAARWYTDDLETVVTFKPADFSGVHGTPHQRFFNLICVAYGAKPETFGDLIGKGYLPQERAEDCKSEFQQAERAFNLLIRPHIDPTLARKVFGKRWMPDVSMQPPRLHRVAEPETGTGDEAAFSTN